MWSEAMERTPEEDDDDFFDKHFEMLPEEPPAFKQAVGHVAASYGLAGDVVTHEMCSVPLTAREFEYVESTLKHALALHQRGEIEAAWYNWGCAKAVVSSRNGFEEGRYESSDRAGAVRLAAEYGKQGSEKKKELNERKREAVVQKLLAQHHAEAFVIRRQLKDAAAKFGPDGGESLADEKWAHRLIKQTRLLRLYESLSARRKP
jgi:hypothetical protein